MEYTATHAETTAIHTRTNWSLCKQRQGEGREGQQDEQRATEHALRACSVKSIPKGAVSPQWPPFRSPTSTGVESQLADIGT